MAKIKKGFSLIELIIVIAIISILVTIVLANMSGGKQDALDSKAWEEMSAINAIAYKCVVINKQTLNTPNNSQVPTNSICSGGDTVSIWPSLPSSYTYGNVASAAGTWYGYSVMASSGGNGSGGSATYGKYRIITCGTGADFSNGASLPAKRDWYGVGDVFNFLSGPSCKTYGI